MDRLNYIYSFFFFNLTADDGSYFNVNLDIQGVVLKIAVKIIGTYVLYGYAKIT